MAKSSHREIFASVFCAKPTILVFIEPLEAEVPQVQDRVDFYIAHTNTPFFCW